MSATHSVTKLLEEWNNGDREALDKLMPLIYEELRRMAKRYMSQQDPGHTLQTTALIHEAYLRMVKQKEKRFENRAHFFGVAAQAMRHILVDYARARHTTKRGGQAYLKLRKGAEAAAEFQKILDHRGQDPLSPLYPLANFGLARAAVLNLDTEKARKAYQDFFALWKDAVPDLPVLIEAKKEYEKVK